MAGLMCNKSLFSPDNPSLSSKQDFEYPSFFKWKYIEKKMQVFDIYFRLYRAPVIADFTLWRVTLYKYGFDK